MRAALAALAVVAILVAAPTSAAAPPPTRWCGTETAGDQPDSSPNVFQVHVVYAYPADQPDQFAARVLPIASDLAYVDGWWRLQDPTRAPRFDLAAFPDCDTTFGQLDVSSLALARTSPEYATASFAISRIAQELSRAGLDDPDKKLLVYYDGPAQTGLRTTCGISRDDPDKGGSDALSIVYLRVCGTLGDNATIAATAAHELLHNLGALAPAGPPHACPETPGHPCDSQSDILYPVSTGAPLATLQLDVGHDDYYAHSGSWWDVQDSLYLEQVQTFALPSGPTRLTATSGAGEVSLSWQPAASPNGAVSYRVYRDGSLLQKSSATLLVDTAGGGATLDYVVRAQDALGYLSPPAEIRFAVGLGIVDADGKLVADTVPPPGVPSLRAVRTVKGIVLRWPAVSDPGGLAGYRVRRNGKPFGALVTGTSLAVPKAKAKGLWTVGAVDAAGNAGPAGARVAVR